MSFSCTVRRADRNLKIKIVYRNMHNLFYDVLLKVKRTVLTDFLSDTALCCIFNLLFSVAGGPSSHGAQPQWHDPEAALPQGLAATSGHMVQPAGPQDPQEEGPPGKGSSHRAPPCGWAHPAHREVPDCQIPQKSSCWQRIQPRRA